MAHTKRLFQTERNHKYHSPTFEEMERMHIDPNRIQIDVRVRCTMTLNPLHTDDLRYRRAIKKEIRSKLLKEHRKEVTRQLNKLNL